MSNWCSTDLFEVMYTTRAMRRLKPDPVPDELLGRLVEAATLAPTDSYSQRWRFLAVTDRTVITEIAGMNAGVFTRARKHAEAALPASVARSVADGSDSMPTAPAMILVAGVGSPPQGSPSFAVATFYGGLFPAVQNLLLCARAAGLGATLTTTALAAGQDRIRELVGAPDDVEFVAVIPVGWPRGRFGRPPRGEFGEVAYLNRWAAPLPAPSAPPPGAPAAPPTLASGGAGGV
jgi:nitroreductase